MRAYATQTPAASPGARRSTDCAYQWGVGTWSPVLEDITKPAVLQAQASPSQIPTSQLGTLVWWKNSDTHTYLYTYLVLLQFHKWNQWEGTSCPQCVNTEASLTRRRWRNQTVGGRTKQHFKVSVCIINPRRACAARVTVVVLCVCLSVCLSATILALQATRRLMSDTNRFRATRAGKITWWFCWNDCVWEIWRENKLKSQYA